MNKYYDIKAQANKTAELWLFGFIGNSIWDDINPKDIIDDLKWLGDLDNIIVHINSEGGSVIGGNVIYNTLKKHAAHVTVKIDGIAASMASVIAMAADELLMAENAFMMIHDPWMWAEGSADDMRKAADILDKSKETLINAYASKTGMSREEISDLMSDETWMTAQEAVGWGFADGITESIDMAASLRPLDLSRFTKSPIANQERETAMTHETSGEQKGPATAGENRTKPPAAAAVDIEAVAAKAAHDALAAEDARIKEVSSIFTPFGEQYASLERACLNDRSIDQTQAQAKLLAKIGESAEPLGYSVTVLEDHRDKMKAGFSSAMMARAGLKIDNQSNEYRGYSLSEMARYCLEASGRSTRRMDRLEMVGAAFTHTGSDFPNLLKDVMFKTMLKGWEETPETYQEWTTRGTLTDFKPTNRVDSNLFPALTEVPEGAEYKYGTMGDRGETIQLATYGKLLSITRQAIINDDLNAFSKIPMKMGRAARRTIGNLVYAILTGNPTMSDGVALFHASHKNLAIAAALATLPLDELRQKMAKQKDPDSIATSLGISPAYLLVPEALRGSAIITTESETEISGSQNNSKKPNMARNIAKVISDARLDAASATAYYTVANPSLHDTIEVAYLDGVDTPHLEQQQGWGIDGTEFKVRIDAGVKAIDFRTFAKNPGA